MQKKLIALAVAAALAPAAAMAADLHEAASGGTHPSVMGTTGTTVYGRIHTSIDSITGYNTAAGATANPNSLAINSSSSRFGVKGSEDLGDGLKAVYQMETGLTSVGGGAADGNGAAPGTGLFTGMRDTYVGLSGGFGTVLAGRLGGSNQYVYDSDLFADQIGDTGSFTGTIPGRVNGVLYYQTPDMSGFSAAAAVIPTSSLAPASNVAGNSYTLKLNYANAGVGVNFFYGNVDLTTVAATPIERKPMSIAGSYDFGTGMVTAQYVKDKSTNTVAAAGADKNADRTIWNIGGKFNVSGNSAIKAQYSKAGDTTGNTTDGATMFAIGYDYSFSKRTGVYVAYAAVNNEAAAAFAVENYGHGNRTVGQDAGEDGKGFSVGLTHNF